MRKVFSIVLTLILVIICSGCGGTGESIPISSPFTVQFEAKTIARDENYSRTFKAMYGQANKFNIGVLQGLYLDNDLQSVVDKIIGDVELIEWTLGISANQFNIYVLDETIPGQPAAVSGNVYCTKDDLYTGLYRVALVEACLGISQQWQAYGIEGIVFSREIDVSELTKFYTDNEDMGVLGLFGTRFMSEWNTKSDLEIAKKTAVSLTEFILENYNYETLVCGATQQIKNEWLKSIGVDRTFAYEYADVLRDAKVSKQDETLVFIITQYASYNLTKIDGQLETSKDIEKFLYRDIAGLNVILEYIKDNAPFNYERLNLDAFRIGSLYDESKSRIDDEPKSFKGLSSHLYSAIHALLPSSASRWQNIGVAEYLSRVIYYDSYERERIFNVFNWHAGKVESGELDINDNEYTILKYYLEHGGGWKTVDDIDMRLYGDACSYGAMHQKDFKCKWTVTPIYIRFSASDKIEGNELSQAQAFSFTTYLIDKFSLEVFLDFCKEDAVFDKVFGQSYESLKEQWLEYLHR